MKRNKIFVFFLIFFIIFSSLAIYAQTTTLNKMLLSLTKPRLTSLQKLNLIESYMGQKVKGAGKVKDVLKSFGPEDEALIYVQKHFRGKQYEIVLTASRESVEKIRKGNTIGFEGTFVGMTFETLRFRDTTIIGKSWWIF